MTAPDPHKMMLMALAAMSIAYIVHHLIQN